MSAINISPTTSQSRRGKTLLITAGLLCATAVILYVSLDTLAEHKIRSMRARVTSIERALLQEVSASHHQSTERHLEHAWDDFNKGLNEALVLADEEVYARMAEGSIDIGAPHVRAILERCGTALASFRDGIRHLDLEGASISPERGSAHSEPAFALSFRPLVNLVLGKARVLVHEERKGEAAHLLLDLCRFSRVVGGIGGLRSERVGLGYLGQTLTVLASLFASGTLSGDILQELESELESSEVIIAIHERVLRRETVYFGYALLGYDGFQTYVEDGDVFATVWERLKYVNSRRFLYSAAFLRCDSLVQREISALKLPWPYARRELSALVEEMQQNGNSLVRNISWIGFHDRELVELITALRLLRYAAHVVRTGSLPALKDPFGDVLQHRGNERTKFSIWTVWHDGVDNGGEGGWLSEAGRDMVLHVSIR